MNILQHIKTLKSPYLRTLLEQMDHLKLDNYSSSRRVSSISPSCQIGQVLFKIKEAAEEQLEHNKSNDLMTQIDDTLAGLAPETPLADKLRKMRTELEKQGNKPC